MDKESGFLVHVLDWSTKAWMEYCDIWSWVPVFYHVPKNAIRSDGKVKPKQNNILHDVLWVAMILLGCLFLLGAHFRVDELHLLGLSIATYRVIDHFLNALKLPLFGWLSPGSVEVMESQRAQRRIILALLYILELILWYAIIYLALARYLGCKFYTQPVDSQLDCVAEALQLSFATMSTVGYGTIAPMDVPTNIVAMMQFFTGLMFITGTIATLAGLLKNAQSEQIKDDDEEGRLDGWQLYLRIFLPPQATLGIILVFYVVFHLSADKMRWSTCSSIVVCIWVSLLVGCLIISCTCYRDIRKRVGEVKKKHFESLGV